MKPSTARARRKTSRIDRVWRALLLLTLLLLPASVPAPVSVTRAQTAPQRPNIVFILSDDHRHDALGIAGHPLLKTPNLDRIGKEGVWFRQAMAVTPLCAPSRAAFLTGLYGHTSGFRMNNAPWPEKFPPSFLSVAREAGYRTAFIGKKHLYNTDEALPGVDRWVSFVNQGLYVDPDVNIDGERKKLDGANGDLLTDFASDFIHQNRGQNRERPFAMVVAYKEAHSAQIAPPRFDALFEQDEIVLPATFNEDKSKKPAFFEATPNIPDTGPGAQRPGGRRADSADLTREQLALKKIRNYYRCVAALDDYVGRLMKALADAGQLDRTILVFAGDNGYFLGDHGRFEKGTPHEESVRIPFLMRYPPAIRPQTVSDELVLNIDLAPTLYDLAGLKGPAKLDGRSLRPIFAGKSRAADWRSEAYLEWQGRQGRPGDAPASEPPQRQAAGAQTPTPTWRALRTRTHKYAVYFNGDLSELYDLRADPKETRNLIQEPSQKNQIEKMHRRLLELAEETNDPLRSMLPATAWATRKGR